jgi:hypothetical protein
VWKRPAPSRYIHAPSGTPFWSSSKAYSSSAYWGRAEGVLAPGAGIALWEVTVEDVTPDPNYLIKTRELDVYINGQFIGHFVDSFGNKTGLGETFTCTFYETFTDPDGNLIEVFGTSDRVPV